MAKLGLKRILAMLVALFLVFSFAACKEKTGTKDQTGTTRGTTAGTQQGEKTQAEEKSYVNKEGFPICNETITITVSGAQSTTPDWNDTLMVQEIEKRF
jgi:hypothetical protein